jgi:hypothetical protein
VPIVNIMAYNEDYDLIGSTQLPSTAANTPWSMTMEAQASPQKVSFYVSCYDNNQNWLFSNHIPSASPVQVSDTDVPGISLVLNYTD